MPPLLLAAITCSSGDNNAVSVLVKLVFGFTDAVTGAMFGMGTLGIGTCGFGNSLLWSSILSLNSSTAGVIICSIFPDGVVLKNSYLSVSDKPKGIFIYLALIWANSGLSIKFVIL